MVPVPMTPFAVQAGEGLAVRTPIGGTLVIKVDASRTDGSLSVMDLVVDPHQGPALHRHHREDELWVVLDGRFRFEAGDQLLVQIAPLHRPTRPLTISDPTTRATLSALHGACEVMGQVARMNQGTFATLARSEQIHIPTRLLDGDILSDDPTTAQAKLTGVRRVIAPPTRVQQTLQHYEAIGAVTGHVAQYQPAVVHAADYDHPALFRQSEFEGRP